jgi:phosphatidylglycerophosphatase A
MMFFQRRVKMMMRANRFCEFTINLFSSFFYIGYLPYAPGTFASFATLAILFFMPAIPVIYFLLGCTILFFVGVFVSKKAALICKKHDPSNVVIDEVLGMSVSVFLAPKIWWIYGLAFLLFRFFDITKFFYIAKFEKISWGWGIMLDDFMAGLLTLGVVCFIRLFIGF